MSEVNVLCIELERKKKSFPLKSRAPPKYFKFYGQVLNQINAHDRRTWPHLYVLYTTYSRKKKFTRFFFIYFQYDIPLKVVRGPTHFWWISTKKSSKLLVLTTCLFQYMSFLHFFLHNEKGRKIRFAKNFSSNTILEIVSTSTYYILPYYHTVEIALDKMRMFSRKKI